MAPPSRGGRDALSVLGFMPLFCTLVTGPRRSLLLKLSDTRVYEPQIRARLGTTAHFCRVVVLELRAVPNWYSVGGTHFLAIDADEAVRWA